MRPYARLENTSFDVSGSARAAAHDSARDQPSRLRRASVCASVALVGRTASDYPPAGENTPGGDPHRGGHVPSQRPAAGPAGVAADRPFNPMGPQGSERFSAITEVNCRSEIAENRSDP